MNIFTDEVLGKVDQVCATLTALPLAEQVDLLNQIRQKLHEVSPFKDEPVDCVLWISSDQVQSNDYNPNKVAPPEMRLLERSIREDGYTQPIVGYAGDGDAVEVVEVVDGFHRTRIGKESKTVRARVRGYVPVSLIKSSRTDRKDRMAATIRHNRARGVHGVMPMMDIVAQLITLGWTDSEIATELGMDADEVLRFKQTKGLPELFKDHTFSRAWE